MGHIMGLARLSIHPAVCLAMHHRLLAPKGVEKTKIGVNFPSAGVTGVPIFTSKS